MKLVNIKINVCQVLLPDDGVRPPKRVGGNIKCVYFICSECAGTWIVNYMK